MPELAEIHSYARNINAKSSGVVFDGINKRPTGKGPDVSLLVRGDFTIFAQARGKELMLTLSPTNGSKDVLVTFRHGLVGIWKCSPHNSSPVHTHISFDSKSSSLSICFVDSNRLGTWFQGPFDKKERGPDPINEFDAFRKNIIVNAVASKALNKSLCECLLNQKFFNGIGNYLRAEILFRARLSPHTNFRELFSLNNEGANRMLALCRSVPLEVYNQKLNKYGNSDDKAAFALWLQVYGKGHFETIKGRKIYFQKNQHLLPFDDVSIPLQAHQVHAFVENVSKPKGTKKSFPVAMALPVAKREFNTTPREKNMKKILLATSMLFKASLISMEEKNWMKNSAFAGDDLVFSALEVFEADSMRELDDFAENIHLMFQVVNNPANSSIFF